jgi:hypothetical protein
MASSVNLGRVQGYSAYEIAQQNGYIGTEEQWLESIKGQDGAQGPQGETGPQGAAGFSPVATVARNQEDNGVVITITDATGTTTATVNDGTSGGGSVPVDPEAEYTNVLTGEGVFANAWDVARTGAYGGADIITEDTRVLLTPDPITVNLNSFPSNYLTDTIQVSMSFYREGEGASGDGFSMDLVSHTQEPRVNETWSYSNGNNITLVFVNNFIDSPRWAITITGSNWVYDGSSYLQTLKVNHDNFVDAVNEVVGSSSSAPTYTAGTGISIANNEISVDNTIATKSELFSGNYNDLTNKPTIPADPDLNRNNVLTGDGSFANAWDTAIDASQKSVAVEDEGVIDRDNISFETTDDFPDWGVPTLDLIVEGLDSNSDPVEINDTLDWDGRDGYSNADYELSKTDDGEGNYTYTISCLNGSDFVSASRFEISFNAFDDVISDYLPDLPSAPSTNGFYTLQMTNGVPSWVSTPIGGSF